MTVGKALTINGAKHGVDARTGRGAAECGNDSGCEGRPHGFSLNVDGITLDGFIGTECRRHRK